MKSAKERRALFQGSSFQEQAPLIPDEEEEEEESNPHDLFSVVLAIFQVMLLILFWVFGKYPKDEDIQENLSLYAMFFKDVAIMVIVGFGFLTAFLRRHRFGSLTYVLLIAVLSFELGILINSFFFSLLSGSSTLVVDVNALLGGLFSAAAVLISFGVLIGKVNAQQVFALVLFEVTFQALNNWICTNHIKALDYGGTIVIHCFGAYFGMGATYFLSPKDTEERAKYAGSDYVSDTFSVLATFFLWCFWPSFNAATAPTSRMKVESVVNTLLALAASSVVTLAASRLFRRSSKWSMEDIQNATLAGGVAIGSSAAFAGGPGPAILIGMCAGAVSVLGYAKISTFLQAKGFHDTAGVNNLHGMPSVLGGIASAIVFGARHNPAWWRQLAALACTLGLAIVSGALSGFVISKLVSGPRKLFNDDEDFHMSVLCAHAGDGCDKKECGAEGRVDPRSTLANLSTYAIQ